MKQKEIAASPAPASGKPWLVPDSFQKNVRRVSSLMPIIEGDGADWTSTTLGDVVTLKRGHDLPPQSRVKGVVPIISSSGVSDFHSVAKVKGPAVVTGRYGTIGKVFYSEQDCWPLNTTLYVENFKGNDSKFVYYLLQTIDYQKYSDKAAVPGVNRNHLHTAVVSIPDVVTQREIANTLSAFDDRISLLRETNATLEAIAQALFKSWFVDFDPVRAKAEGREPEGVPPEIAALFPSEFEDSELGEIPKGWRVGTFGEITDVVGGGTPSTKEPTYWEDGRHCWATPKDLSGMDTPVLLDTERKITDAGLAKISSGLLPVGTVLMSSRAPIGYLAFAEVPVAVNQGFIAMKPKNGISNLFLLDLLRVQMDEIKSHANGSTFMEISKAAFRPLKVVVPPTPVIQAFDDVARSLYERMVGNVRQIDSLTDLRDTLLPRLMSGKLRIPEAVA